MTIRAELADGTILEFPDGTDQAVIQSVVKRQMQQQAISPDILAQAQQKNPSLIPAPEGGVAEQVLEPAAALVTGAVAEPVAGFIGTATALAEGPEAGAEAVESTREALTFEPRTEAGRGSLESVGETVVGGLDAINQFGRDIGVPEVLLKPVGDVAFEATGDPAIAAGVSAIPTAIFEFLGLKGIQRARSGTRLKKPDGTPTKALEKELDKQGLVFENLSDEAKQAIPEVAPKRLIPGADEAASPAEEALAEQIRTGGRDSSLAGLKLEKGRVAADAAGLEAVRQGFDEGFVQAVKTASPETKTRMADMLSISQRISKNKRLALDIRPTHVVGDSVSSRVTFIRDKANKARKDLNRISRVVLKDLDVDPAPVVNRLQESLADLDIDLIDGPKGVPQPVFKGSLISKDKTSQRAIRDLVDLMSEGGRPDALRFHKLKRQLDNIIDFNKKSAQGLSDAGRNVLKDIRAELNNSVRGVSDDYARVNDVLSSSLRALDDFQKASGSSIDIFGKGSSEAIGQDMRGLMSNRKTRVKLENSVDQLNKVASDLGGKFNDDIKDLAFFARSLEDRFGAVAKTSLKGEIETTGTRLGQQGAKATVLQAGVERLAKGAEKLRGINDLNAFRAMRELLKRQQ
jgi:hypothetical protein